MKSFRVAVDQTEQDVDQARKSGIGMPPQFAGHRLKRKPRVPVSGAPTHATDHHLSKCWIVGHVRAGTAGCTDEKADQPSSRFVVGRSTAPHDDVVVAWRCISTETPPAGS